MTNRIAISLALVIAALFALDLAMGWGGTLFLLKKFFALLNWLMFWR